MKKVLWVATLVLCAAAATAQVKLPVFTLRYSGGFGSEELEEDDALEPASARSSVSLRIKEEISRALVTNLTFFYSTKDYYDDETGDYTYFYLKPQVAYDLTDRLTVETELRSKWVRYDEADSSGDSKDYLELSGGLSSTYEPVRGTRLTALVGTGFDLYDNRAKAEQLYLAGLRILSRHDSVTLGGGYRGTYFAPLGASSNAGRSLTSEVAMSVTWDPNR
jgi:hypothetical protein